MPLWELSGHNYHKMPDNGYIPAPFQVGRQNLEAMRRAQAEQMFAVDPRTGLPWEDPSWILEQLGIPQLTKEAAIKKALKRPKPDRRYRARKPQFPHAAPPRPSPAAAWAERAYKPQFPPLAEKQRPDAWAPAPARVSGLPTAPRLPPVSPRRPSGAEIRARLPAPFRQITEVASALTEPFDERGMPNADLPMGPLMGVGRKALKKIPQGIKPGPMPKQLAPISPQQVNPDDFFNFKYLKDATEAEHGQLRQLVQEQVALSGGAPKQRITFQQIAAEAKEIDPEILKHLKFKAGETLDPRVRVAMRTQLNNLNGQLVRARKQLQDEVLVGPAREQLSRQAEQLERSANGLIDTLYKTRTQDGRNLVFHRIMAASRDGFDVDYWLNRARKAGGGALTDDTKSLIGRLTEQGRLAREAGDAAGEQKAGLALAKAMQQLDHSGLLETILTLRKAGLLSGLPTQGRNLGGNTAWMVMNEVAAGPAAAADIFMSMATGRRTVMANYKGVAAAGKEMAARGVRELVQIMKHGATPEQLARYDIPKELNSSSKIANFYSKVIFRSMAAGDRPFRAYGFKRSLDERALLIARNEAAAGEISRKAVARRTQQLIDKPPETMVMEAIADSEAAVFAEKGAFTKALGKGRTVLREHGPVGKGLDVAIDLIIPFTTTPSNIIKRVVEASPLGLASATAAIPTAMAYAKVTGKLNPEAQRTIAKAFGRGAVGSGLFLLGYFGAKDGWMSGLPSRNPGERAMEDADRLPGAVLVDGKWRQVFTFSPAGNLIAMGATYYEEQHRPRTEPFSPLGGVATLAGETVLEQPFMGGTKEAVKALASPERSAERFLGRMIGSFAPTGLAHYNRSQDDYRRETPGLLGSLRERSGIGRKDLPIRTDVFGQRQRQAPGAWWDPTIGKPSLKDPGFREMKRLHVNLGPAGRRPEAGEGFQERKLRQDVLGTNVLSEINRLVGTERYRKANDTARKVMLKTMLSAQRTLVNRGIASPYFEAVERIRNLKAARRRQRKP